MSFRMHCEPQCPHLAVLVVQVGRTPQMPTKNNRGGGGGRGVLKDRALESKTTRVPKARNPRAPSPESNQNPFHRRSKRGQDLCPES